MEKMKKWLLKWTFALLATVMVLASLVGCSSKDVETALDVAVDIIEVVDALESLEAEEYAAAKQEDSSTISTTQTTKESSVDDISTDAAWTETEATEVISTEVTSTEAESSEAKEHALTVEEDGHYTSKEEVALYLYTYGKLPSNFISKKEAEDLGWKKKQGEAGQLHVVAPGMSIGGSSFGNYEGLLPEKKGRRYYECDINYVKGNRGAERIVYSNDGLIFYTGDHYESFEQLYPKE